MTPEDADRSLDSPLRLVVVAELLARGELSVREAVLTSGRHEQDVVASLAPLVAGGVVARSGDSFRIGKEISAPTRRALEAGIDARRDRLERERFVRANVLGSMIGVDPKMQIVFEAIRHVCRLEVSVLITGETGSGKELVARAIHELGVTRHGPIESVNCAAMPAALFESHMFGHVRGAFTGATRDHAGVIERCDGGTLFLDEIGELELQQQAKLLRVLQDHTFHRLGDHVERRSTFRLIVATHRDLPAMIAAGTFREDLYYRCNVFAIRVPSLRERLTDLPYIVDDLLRRNARAVAMTTPPPVTDAALAVLAAHRWPGNVRELENVLVRATIAAGGGPIRREHIPVAADPSPPVAVANASRARTLGEIERDHVVATLAATGGNLTTTADQLGVARATLYRILRRHGIPRPRRA